LVPLYVYVNDNEFLFHDREKFAQVKLLYLKERFSFKFQLRSKSEPFSTLQNSLSDTFVCSTVSQSTSSVHQLKHKSIIDFDLVHNTRPNSESNFFYMHPAEVREQTLLIEKSQPEISSFRSPAKKFVYDMYDGNTILPLKNAVGDISGQIEIENFEIVYHLGIHDYLPHMKIHFDYAIDFSENLDFQNEQLRSVYEVLKVNTMLRVAKLNPGFVNTEGYVYAFGANFQSPNKEVIIVNEQPGNIDSLVLRYQKTLRRRYLPHTDTKCIPGINAFLQKHSIDTSSMGNATPFKYYILNLVLNNLCSDWEETKILLKEIKNYPVSILVILANPRVNILSDVLFGFIVHKFLEHRAGIVNTVQTVTVFPALLHTPMDLYEISFAGRILEVFSKHKMIPPINNDTVKEDVRQFLLH